VARFNTMALLLSIACFCVFTWRFGGQHLPRIERALWWITGLLLATQVVVPDAYVGHAQLVGIMVAAAIFYFNALQFLFHALRTRQREHALLAGCLLILLAASLHDLLLLLAVLRGSYPISPYTSIVVTLCLSGILGLRHAQRTSYRAVQPGTGRRHQRRPRRTGHDPGTRACADAGQHPSARTLCRSRTTCMTAWADRSCT
jgi:hypothetical protein